MGAPTHILTHVTDAQARLLEEFKEIVGPTEFLGAVVPQIQAIEDALWQVLTLRYLDTVEGVRVDVLGRILGEPRDGFGDADYLERLKARIRVLRSSGTAPNLLKIFKLLLPENVIKFDLLGGAAFILNIGLINAAFAPIYTRFVHDAKSAGINGHVLYSTGDDAITFQFSSDPDPTVAQSDAAQGFGDTANAATGGIFAGVII